MKKFTLSMLAAVLALVMLTACGNNGNADETSTETAVENSVVTEETTVANAETTAEQTTTKETTSVATTAETEVTTQAKKALTFLSADELSDEDKKVFEELNSWRSGDGLAELIPAEELNYCAKVITGELTIDTLTDATRADGSSYRTIFDDENIGYTNCEIIDGMTFYEGYEGVVNSISFSRSARTKIRDGQWKYAGFYHDPKSLYWTILLITDEGDPVSQADADVESSAGMIGSYYDDSTAYAAFDTYMRTLVYDDYATYLAITHQSDSNDVAESYDYKKEGYVGMSLSDIEYYETELDPLLGGYADYKVSEFDSSGDIRMDINTMGTAYGTVIVEKDYATQRFYVDAHIRFSPFFNIQ